MFVRSGTNQVLPKPGTRNPEPGTRNPEPGTRNPKPETRNPEPETRNPEPGPNGALKSAIRTAIGLGRNFRPELKRLAVTLSVGNPLRPYGIAYRRAYGLLTCGVFKKSQ